MVGDGHVDRIDAAFAHLLEDLFRPVVVLHGIDARAAAGEGLGQVHSGAPAAM